MSYERRKVRTGRVVSDKMDRTIVVQVEWRTPHRLYKKPVRRMSKFRVHDPDNVSMVGDIVQVIETRPRSKTKRWRLVKILQRREMVDIRPEDIGEDAQPAVMPEPAVEPVSVPPIRSLTSPQGTPDDAAEDSEPVAEAETEPETELTEPDESAGDDESAEGHRAGRRGHRAGRRGRDGA
jgi:small subunit ribosomal protein S17